MPKRHEGIGDDARLRRTRRLVRVRVGDLAEIDKSALVVLRDAVAGSIHAPDFPLRDQMALIGRVLQGGEAFGLVRAFRHARAAQAVIRRQRRRARTARAVEGGNRAVDNAEAQYAGHGDQHAAPDNAGDMLRCPHSTLSQPNRPDG